MHTGYIGGTPPALYRTGSRAIPREDQHRMQDSIRAYIAGFLDGESKSTEDWLYWPASNTCERLRISSRSQGLVDAFATLNYSKQKAIDVTYVAAYLISKGLLVPVTTEALLRRDHMRLPEAVNLAR